MSSKHYLFDYFSVITICDYFEHPTYVYMLLKHRVWIANLPQTVPTAIEAAFVNRPVAEDKALPQRRPPFVNAAADIAAIAAVSAPGTLIKIKNKSLM